MLRVVAGQLPSHTPHLTSVCGSEGLVDIVLLQTKNRTSTYKPPAAWRHSEFLQYSSCCARLLATKGGRMPTDRLQYRSVKAWIISGGSLFIRIGFGRS